MPDPNSSIWKIIPQFQTTSVQRTINFYTTNLSFTLGGTQADNFCSLFTGYRAAANIYFFKCSTEEFHPRAAMIATGTKELDELYSLLKEKDKVEVVEEIGDKEWGFRQFSIKDDSGNELTFFRFLGGTNGEGEAAEEKKKMAEEEK